MEQQASSTSTTKPAFSKTTGMQCPICGAFHVAFVFVGYVGDKPSSGATNNHHKTDPLQPSASTRYTLPSIMITLLLICCLSTRSVVSYWSFSDRDGRCFGAGMWVICGARSTAKEAELPVLSTGTNKPTFCQICAITTCDTILCI